MRSFNICLVGIMGGVFWRGYGLFGLAIQKWMCMSGWKVATTEAKAYWVEVTVEGKIVRALMAQSSKSSRPKSGNMKSKAQHMLLRLALECFTWYHSSLTMCAKHSWEPSLFVDALHKQGFGVCLAEFQKKYKCLLKVDPPFSSFFPLHTSKLYIACYV
jgi:hypothetical protein